MRRKSKKGKQEAQNPLILRSHRLMEAFAKSDDERDFYLDRVEGFIIYVDLDKSENELLTLEKALAREPERYCMIPKLTFYETKKIMEGFVNEKVYDVDTKEKLLDIIQSKEARENYLEFIYDHHTELEKWQQYYQERSRIRIIEWLRNHHFHFVFEEDLDLSTKIIENLKRNLFEKKVGRDIEDARSTLSTKAKTYYSNEALNPRPKRGRPPKQAQKLEMEPQVTSDIYISVPSAVRPFLFTPEISSVFDVTFSARFETGEELLAHRRQVPSTGEHEESMNNISQKLATLRKLSSHWMETEPTELLAPSVPQPSKEKTLEEQDEEQKKLLRKLQERKKIAFREKPQAEKLKRRKLTRPKVVRKLILKSGRTKKASPAPTKKKEAAPKTSAAKKPKPKAKMAPVKRILPKAKKTTKAKAKPKPKVPTKKKIAKTPVKRAVRKITPKKPTIEKKATTKAKVSAKSTITKKKPLRKTKPITTKAKAKTTAKTKSKTKKSRR